MIDQIADIVKVTNIPTDLKEFGVKPEDLDFLVDAGSKQQRLLVCLLYTSCHGGLWRACLPQAVIESHFYPMTRTYTLMNVGFVEAIPPALFRDNSVYCGAP